MKKIYLMTLLAVMAFSGCKTFPDTEGYDLKKGRIEHITVWNSDSTSSRDVAVYLPYNYCESCPDSLPSIYILLPYGRSADEFLSIYPVFDVVDRMLSAGVIPPAILVMVDGEGRHGSNFYAGGAEDFLLNDIMAEVGRNYHVFADSSYRAVIGVGPMGGYGALRLYFRHPDVFGSVAAHSPIVDPMDYAENVLLPGAMNETGGHLPNPPIHPEHFPNFEELLSMGLAFSPITGPMDSFDLSHQFPLEQIGDSTWLGASLPWDTLGNPVDDSATNANWGAASILAMASGNIENVWDTSAVWIDLGRDDETALEQPIQQLVDTLNAYGKAPIFQTYDHDVADPDSILPVTWDSYLLVRINYSIGEMLKIMWYR